MPAVSYSMTLFEWAGIEDDPPRASRQLRRCRQRVKAIVAGKKPRRRRGIGRLSVGMLSVLLDRIEAGMETGRLDVMDDPVSADSVSITMAELIVLFEVLFPEDWPRLVPAAMATGTAPGTDSRLAVYRERSRNGEQLYHVRDSCPVRGDVDGRLVAAGRLALAIRDRGNGTGPKVLGWHS